MALPGVSASRQGAWESGRGADMLSPFGRLGLARCAGSGAERVVVVHCTAQVLNKNISVESGIVRLRMTTRASTIFRDGLLLLIQRKGPFASDSGPALVTN